ncbi:hypothetical protein H2201_002189 [Coniosporium apollinis]|uniref:Uncharacterized protein n=1 Tax=Coniosporium apollinis TaxID=61459 RepID=A0ABQ9P281_9PEZI|nr:hypothetical protein H2201_002189 [Coniosporium apollinis]
MLAQHTPQDDVQKHCNSAAETVRNDAVEQLTIDVLSENSGAMLFDARIASMKKTSNRMTSQYAIHQETAQDDTIYGPNKGDEGRVSRGGLIGGGFDDLIETGIDGAID